MVLSQNCPKCGGEIEFEELVDSEFCEGQYYDTVTGHCSKCGRWYQWNDVFRYDHSEDLHEIENEG